MKTIVKVVPLIVAAAILLSLVLIVTPNTAVTDQTVAHSSPATCVFQGQTYVFIRGQDSRLYYRVVSDEDSNWIYLGGILTSSPAVSATSDKMTIFVRGSDSMCYFRTTTNGWLYNNWESFNGPLY